MTAGQLDLEDDTTTRAVPLDEALNRAHLLFHASAFPFLVRHGRRRVQQTCNFVRADRLQCLGAVIAPEKEKALHVARIQTPLLDIRAIGNSRMPTQLGTAAFRTFRNRR